MNKAKWGLLILAIPLSGCFYQSVNNVDIRKAIKYCGSLENIVEIQAHLDGREYAFCDNTARTSLDDVLLESK